MELKQAREVLRPLQGDLLRLLTELVQTATVNIPPNGAERAGQLVLQEFFSSQGMTSELYETKSLTSSDHAWVRRDRNYQGRENLAVRITGSGRGKSLLLNGHMDTVPAHPKGWCGSPWSGNTRDGRLYGLGSFDMKAGVAAQAAVVCALAKAGIRLRGDLIFESVVDEEWGGGGGTLAARLRDGAADACVICEGTQLEIFRATRGGFVVDLIAEAGDSSAYFSDREVVSPAVALGRLLGWVDELARERRRVTALGAYAGFADRTPVQVLAVEANRLTSEVPLSVPLRGAVRLYLQFLPEEDVDAVLAGIRESLNRFAAADAFLRQHPIGWKPLYDPPLLGHELADDHAWTKCLTQAAGAALGHEPKVTGAPYPCDAFLLQREFGIPTLLFGPRGAGAHNANEYVEVESVFETAETLLAAAMLWCGE